MQITSIRLGLTRNLGNYESAKLEVEAVPSEGQKADETLAELHQYVAGSVSGIQGTAPPQHASTVNETKPAETKAPAEEKPKKRKRGRPRKNATKAEEKPKAEPTPTPAADDVPFDTDDDKPDLIAIRSDLPPSSADGATLYDRQVRFAREAETLEELLERFNEMRDWAANHSTDRWEKDVTWIAQRYRELNTPGADVDTQDNLVAAFKAERTFINERRKREGQKAAA